MSRLVLFLSVFLFAASSVVAQSLPKFTIMTEDWVPYQYYQGTELKGISVDLMVEMLARTGSSQSREDIELLPWARAYQTLNHQQNSILFSMTKTAERLNAFRWVGPLFNSSTYLIAAKKQNIKLSGQEDLRNYEFGTIRDDVSEMFLKRFGVDPESFTRHNNTLSNLKMLNAGRIDMIVSGWEAFTSDAYSLGVDPDNYEKVFVVDTSDVSIAFHKDTANWIIEKFQKALDDIKADGTYDRVIEKYKAFEKDN
jgi:polar amino acid transport system substrate-binding protein